MIGNLFSAICIAAFSSIIICGDVRAAEVTNKAVSQSTSWVDGSNCDVYYTGSFKKTLYSANEYGSYEVINYSDELIDEDAISVLQFYDTYINALNNVVNNTNDSYIFAYQSLPHDVTINNKLFKYCFRVGVPVGSSVTGFEFRINTDVVVYKYNDGFDGFYIPSNYYFNGQTLQTSIGLYDNSVPSVNSSAVTITSLSSGDNDYLPYRFSEYLFLFANDNPVRTTLDLQFQLINGGSNDYNVGYTNGFSVGYNQGNLDGYNKGYADGLATAQQSSFMGLFNSIADTPLRFIYGLFSFDLFGTSMLVIVMTLLTGIVLFGIIKKFWK